MKKYTLIVLFLLSVITITAQEWTLKLRSSVELRTFKLTSEADVSESKLPGATIALSKGSSVINQIQSDGNGDFIIDVPANGEFILTISYPGCNPKKFAINTMGVPEEIAKDNYKPTFGIEGVIMAKAFATIDYSILKQPLVRIRYVSNGKKFDDEEAYTSQILTELSRVKTAEDALIENFTTTNKVGDVALSKGNCPLAKASYEKAMTIIPGEPYPGTQLPKVGDCLKNKDEAAKKAAEEAAAKAAAAKLAAEKAEADKLAKEKAATEKAEADKLTKDKAAADKAEADRLAKEKAEIDQLAKEKGVAEKADADRLAAEKDNAAKIQKDKEAKDKAEAEKLAKEKATAEKVEADRLAAEQGNTEQMQKDKEAKDKAAADKLAKDKSTAEKTEADRLAKEKSNADKTQKDKEAKDKTEADKLAKQKAIADQQQADKAAKDKMEADRIAKEKTTTTAKEPTNGITPSSTGSEPGTTAVGSGDAKYSIPQALGADKYKGTIKRADELFKMKRYPEAKPMYEEALKQKPNDPLAIARLAEIEKLTKK
jgi:hypothetical protein